MKPFIAEILFARARLGARENSRSRILFLGTSTKKKEALKFAEDLNRKYKIPDTDSLEMREEWEKRKRSDTISTVSSDKPGPKYIR